MKNINSSAGQFYVEFVLKHGTWTREHEGYNRFTIEDDKHYTIVLRLSNALSDEDSVYVNEQFKSSSL